MRNLKYGSKELMAILDEVDICKKLFCTKNGKTYSMVAEEFLEWMGHYNKYLIPEKVEEWNSFLRKRIYDTLVLKADVEETEALKNAMNDRKHAIISDLFNFIDAIEVMEKYSETSSWEQTREVISEQGHSGYSFSGMCNVMLNFSIYGVEFVEEFSMRRVERDDKFRQLYEDRKTEKNVRGDLNKRLIYALKVKLNK